jgi:hypothetical protein
MCHPCFAVEFRPETLPAIVTVHRPRRVLSLLGSKAGTNVIEPVTALVTPFTVVGDNEQVSLGRRRQAALAQLSLRPQPLE